MSDNDYWMRQYQQGPFGADKSIPAARRNKGKAPKKGSDRARTVASAVMKRAQAIARAHGCDMSAAMKQAWAEVREQSSSRSNPWAMKKNPWFSSDGSNLFLPDTTHTREALVEAPYAWSDETEVRSALVEGPYGRMNPRGKKNALALKNALAFRKARKNSDYDFQGFDRPREERDSPEFVWSHHPAYEQIRGQFSTGEDFTRGFQPMNRRNPKGVMTARFPGICANCGGDLVRGQPIGDSGKRGPKGGKKMAHINCMR